MASEAASAETILLLFETVKHPTLESDEPGVDGPGGVLGAGVGSSFARTVVTPPYQILP